MFDRTWVIIVGNVTIGTSYLAAGSGDERRFNLYCCGVSQRNENVFGESY
jgi:hypothetical protein